MLGILHGAQNILKHYPPASLPFLPLILSYCHCSSSLLTFLSCPLFPTCVYYILILYVQYN